MAAPALVHHSATNPMTAIRFTAELGRALHRWGAPAHQLDLRFERRPLAAGIGLGLALSRGLARSLGGDLSLANGAPGEPGACFRLTLPA